MYIWFLVSLLGLIGVIPLYFLSVEHLKLQKRYGKKKGTRIGDILGLISGYGFFLSWIGIWISPQPRFTIPFIQNLPGLIPIFDLLIPLIHLIVFAVFLIPGAWFAIMGVKETTLKAAETHRTEKIVTAGVYSYVRHPQYLGGLLAHIGISFLLSAWFSLLSTPLVVALIYFLSWKEEEELIREFSKEYEDYKKEVPMLIPRFR